MLHRGNFRGLLMGGAPGRNRTCDLSLHPTSAFAAPCGFVGWTLPSPWVKTCRRELSSLYTFPSRGLARRCHGMRARGFTEFNPIQTALSLPPAQNFRRGSLYPLSYGGKDVFKCSTVDAPQEDTARSHLLLDLIWQASQVPSEIHASPRTSY